MENLRYFDYAATTPADPRVIAAMSGCLGIDGAFGNPASNSHLIGQHASQLVECARKQVAKLVGADTHEIIWTSGATESNNLALKGFADAAATKRHLVTSLLEHKAILDTVKHLEKRGFPASYAHPTPSGDITAESIAETIRPDTGLVSVMMVNNEIGSLTDIAGIARVVHEAGALLHVDAAQALGKTRIDVKALGIDLMSMSGHKVYGPKGIGALYVSDRAAQHIEPQMHGGGHERGLRSGTLATHQIVGMGMACELAMQELDLDHERITRLGQLLLDGILHLPGVVQNAKDAIRIPHTLSLTINLPDFFPFLLSGELAVSSTSACNSATGAASHVLTAIGLTLDEASRTVRLSLGRFTTQDDVDCAVSCLQRIIAQCQPQLLATGTLPV